MLNEITANPAPHSPVSGPSGRRERRIHAIRVPVDELSPHAGDQCPEYHSNVGYLSGASLHALHHDLANRIHMPGRRDRCVFTVPSVCLLCLPGAMEQEAAGDGLPGKPPLSIMFLKHLLISHLQLPGNHHVSAVAAHTRLGRPRDRDAAQRSVRPLLDMAQRPEPLRQVIPIPLVFLGQLAVGHGCVRGYKMQGCAEYGCIYACTTNTNTDHDAWALRAYSHAYHACRT